MQQRSEAWWQARLGRITGSRFSRAMAARTSSTYHGLISELIDERRTGRCDRSGYVNAAMQWGIDHEASAREWYCRQYGRRVQEIGFVVHPRLDYVGVSPDGLVANDGLVEIKCPQMKAFRQVMTSRELPSRYRWQVQGQLWVCQRQWLDFVCFYPPRQGICLRVDRDEGDSARLEERCRQIHLEVEGRVGSSRVGPATVTARHKPAKPVALPDTLPDMAKGSPQPNRQGMAAWVWIGLVLLAFWLLGR